MFSSHPTLWLTAAAIALFGYLGVTGDNPGISSALALPVHAIVPEALAIRDDAPAPNLQTGSRRIVRIFRSADGLFYVTARVNGTPIRFLIDTGANMVVLTAQDAQKAGVKNLDVVAASVDTANGTSEMPRAILKHVAVADLQASHIHAAIMRNGLKVSLLGQNMLSKLGVITMSGDEISIQAGS